MGHRAAQFLRGHSLVGHGLDDLGTGDEHVGSILDHEDEVGHGRAIDGAAGAGAHDQRDLRDYAGGHHIALEDVGIATEGRHAFLDAGAARVVETDHRRADLHGVIHDLADLLGVGFGKCAAKHGEVLGEDEHHAAVDGAVAGDDTVTGHLLLGHAEVVAAVLLEHVPLFESTGVEQQLDALAGCQLALLVLCVDAPLTAAKPGG